MQLFNAAQRTLSAKIEALDPYSQYEWQKAEELRYSFMSVVVAAANRFEMKPSIPWGFLRMLISGMVTIGSIPGTV
jgi:hypothetical protein